ncbi:tRNA wybutosine-synthesizing protein 5 [Lepeophtheirus salmonis]|uniref:tRNA wybutosine-synthesizing protein 5 n=1 Tax=Lepeophtheirus salmonis TaxID=72036 RepID=UPI001AE1FF20|nr:bifunctional peptidase and arginyl-hydroxylase JMJD5-like [Lepeophtheirus salmonis]
MLFISMTSRELYDIIIKITNSINLIKQTVMPSIAGIKSNTEIQRVSFNDLSPEIFHRDYFLKEKPVVITECQPHWHGFAWTIPSLVDKCGDNEVSIRGETHKDSYRVGKAYNIRKDSFRNYAHELLTSHPRSLKSYLAVASVAQAFPQLLPITLPIDALLGKLHLGPYLWVAHKGHYEFCHFDPDDNFLIMIQGRKNLRLFKYDLDILYPNPLGSEGKTIQSRIDLDNPDFKSFPKFREAHCEYTTLHPGEILFIPAFYWHQVSALDDGISMNAFYGDKNKNDYVNKVLNSPCRLHFEYWIKNVIQQNSEYDSFQRMLPRLDEVLHNFFLKQWHEEASKEQILEVLKIVMNYIGISKLPLKNIENQSKFPPVLKIRGLLYRKGLK